MKHTLSQPYSLASLIRGLQTKSDPTPEVLLGELLRENNPDTPDRVRLGTRTALLPDMGFARALGAVTASQGADLIIASVQRVAAAARPQLALDLAGVPRLELRGTGPLTLPSWKPETVPGGWLGHSASGTENQLTVQTANASPRSCYAYLDLSREIQKLVPLIEGDVLVELGRAVRNVLENGFINGTGSEHQPLGLLRIPGATRNNWAAATPTRAELITQLENFSKAHGSLSTARWLLNSDLIARMLASEAAASTGVFNLAIENSRPTILGVPAIISEAMPDDRLLLIEPQSIRQVYWGSPAALSDPYTHDISGSLRLLVYNDADCVSLQPAMVCVGGPA